MKKILLLFMCLCLLLSIVGCSNDVPSTTEPDVPETDEDVDNTISCPLPELDFEDESVVIHVRGDADAIAEIGLEDEGTLMSSTLYERTLATEERLGVLIEIAQGNSWDAYNSTIGALRGSISSGLGEYDIIAGWSPRIPVLAAEGYFHDVNTFDYIDSTASWWSQSANEAMTLNNKLYMLTGDIAASYMDNCMAVIFNQPLAESYGYDYSTFYSVVKAGEWTMEYLYTLSKDAYQDANGNDIRDDADFFGILTSPPRCDCFWDSCDISIIKKDEDGKPTLAFDTEKIQSVYDLVQKLMVENTGALLYGVGPNISVQFDSGRVLFLIQELKTLATFTGMQDDYGVLPVPKFDTTQTEYYTDVWSDMSLWGVPIDAKNSEKSAAVLTSLAYDSHVEVIEIHYEVLLKHRYVRDSESGEMIDLIYNSVSLDFDNIWNEVIATSTADRNTQPNCIFRQFLYNNDNGVASWWASYGEGVKEGLKKVVDSHYSNN